MNKNDALKRIFELSIILSLCSGCRNEPSQGPLVANKTQSGPS